MRGATRIEHIRDGASILENIYLRVMIRLELSRVKASGEKMQQIGSEQEHHGYREETFQKRKEKCSEKIRAESDKSSVEQSTASSVRRARRISDQRR